jgi:non-specific serine/threonine protein kinase
MDPLGEGFGALLRHYRVLAGLTQEQLAERAGLSRRGIADLERGARRAPYAATIERLAAALELSAPERVRFSAAGRKRLDSSIGSANVSAEGRAVGGTRVNRAAPRFSVLQEHTRLQLVTDNRPSETRTAESRRRTNLPVPSTSFIGRLAEVSQVAQLLESGRLVTLTGPGGVGKTRLGIQAAMRLIPEYADGVWLVELAPLSDPDLVPRACTAVLGVQEKPGTEVIESLIEWLRGRHVLLILDNCEHLIASCARLAHVLLRSCGDLHILATSRELLRTTGESILHVQPLTIPVTGADARADSIRETDSVKLLSERASSVAARFLLTDQNAEAVARICQRLDGNPLALELAAARLRALSVAELAARLDRRFALLTTGSRTGLAQHQTLRAMVEWSYDLLNQDEQLLFERAAVFAGSWSLEAIEAICSGDGIPREHVLDVTARLVDKSLLQTDVLPDAGTRYRLSETLHEFAFELLERTGVAEEWRRRHAMYFAHTTLQRWGPLWWCEDTALRALEVEREYYNLQATLSWLINSHEAAAAQHLAGVLAFFWIFRERVGEGRFWLRQVLELPTRSGSDEMELPHASALVGLAHLATLTDNLPEAEAIARAGLTAARHLGDARLLAQALLGCGWLTWVVEHDSTTALAQMRESLEISEASDLQGLAAVVRVRLAELLCETDDFVSASQLLEKNLALGKPLDFLSASFGGFPIVRLLFARGAYEEAASILEVVSARERRNGSPLGATYALTILSWARLALGDLARARASGRQALILARDNVDQSTAQGHLAAPFEALAQVAAAAGDANRALLIAGAAASLREQSGFRQTPREQALVERGLTPARTALGPKSSAEAWARGQELSLERAIAEALAAGVDPS